MDRVEEVKKILIDNSHIHYEEFGDSGKIPIVDLDMDKAATQICQLFESKPVEKVCTGCPDRFQDCMTKAKCQERAERIFEEIEVLHGKPFVVDPSGTLHLTIEFSRYQVLKKQEGVK